MALVIGIDGDESDVGAGAAALDVDAGAQVAVVLSQQEDTLENQFADAVGVDAFARHPRAFGNEGAIDQAREGVGVLEVGGADVERGHWFQL